MLHSSDYGCNLEVTVHSAHDLEAGQNDAYARVSFQLKDYSFQKTIVKSGSNPEWQQTVLLRDVGSEHENLYLEIMDESGELIAFCAIPLSQVYSHEDQQLSARFGLYTPARAQKGEVLLTIRVLSSEEKADSELTYEGLNEMSFSKLDEEHMRRLSSRFKFSVDRTSFRDGKALPYADDAQVLVAASDFINCFFMDRNVVERIHYLKKIEEEWEPNIKWADSALAKLKAGFDMAKERRKPWTREWRDSTFKGHKREGRVKWTKEE
ncbi:hypothetical protein BGZ72_004948 [Mortierella alpina]|nr:hypothetical protein BGZ72_004948 [Mortierella alpina]